MYTKAIITRILFNQSPSTETENNQNINCNLNMNKKLIKLTEADLKQIVKKIS